MMVWFAGENPCKPIWTFAGRTNQCAVSFSLLSLFLSFSSSLFLSHASPARPPRSLSVLSVVRAGSLSLTHRLFLSLSNCLTLPIIFFFVSLSLLRAISLYFPLARSLSLARARALSLSVHLCPSCALSLSFLFLFLSLSFSLSLSLSLSLSIPPPRPPLPLFL